jgi:hypothetical protein
VSAKIIPYG